MPSIRARPGGGNNWQLHSMNKKMMVQCALALRPARPGGSGVVLPKKPQAKTRCSRPGKPDGEPKGNNDGSGFGVQLVAVNCSSHGDKPTWKAAFHPGLSPVEATIGSYTKLE